MKRNSAFNPLMAIMLIAAVALTACGPTPPPEEVDEATAPEPSITVLLSWPYSEPTIGTTDEDCFTSYPDIAAKFSDEKLVVARYNSETNLVDVFLPESNTPKALEVGQYYEWKTEGRSYAIQNCGNGLQSTETVSQ